VAHHNDSGSGFPSSGSGEAAEEAHTNVDLLQPNQHGREVVFLSTSSGGFLDYERTNGGSFTTNDGGHIGGFGPQSEMKMEIENGKKDVRKGNARVRLK